MDASEKTFSITDYIENGKANANDGITFEELVRLLDMYAKQTIEALSGTTLPPMSSHKYLMLQPPWIKPQLPPVPESVANIRAIDVFDYQNGTLTYYVFLTRDNEWLQVTRIKDGPDDSYNVVFSVVTTEEFAKLAVTLSHKSELKALRDILFGITEAMDDRLEKMQQRYDAIKHKQESLKGTIARIDSLT